MGIKSIYILKKNFWLKMDELNDFDRIKNSVISIRIIIDSIRKV